MSDIHQLLERQSQWQKRRANLSWSKKIHIAEAMRETVLEFQKMRHRLCDPLGVSRDAAKIQRPRDTILNSS